ncbi:MULTISPECIES: hypothetical protein [Streptacidiphilus]|uniref:Uncharacterized protein n=1 Tax=Streptacidiphilus cavernicola TaxID=3342716 RepID=A0ABV6UMP3_9ACTN|nr:hypothetical protein [Streptacidiphilus jeojiense]
MAGERRLRDLLHGETHRVPGVPAHVEHPAGHQGKALQRRSVSRSTAANDRSRNGARGGGWNHSSARPPRVLAAWQRRIAALFGQESP